MRTTQLLLGDIVLLKKISIQWKAVVWPYDHGYRVFNNGKPVNSVGLYCKLHTFKNQRYPVFYAKENDYPFMYKYRNGDKPVPIQLHKLTAFQRFGFKAMQPGVVIRHFNDDPMDCSLGNIVLGTHHENMRDKVRHKFMEGTLE